MTLSEFARALGTSPKRVINTLHTLGQPLRYTDALARRLAVTLAIHDATRVPLAHAHALAAKAIAAWRGDIEPVIIRGEAADAGVVVDVRRVLAGYAARLAVARDRAEQVKRGRPPARQRNALKAAADWGIDVPLLAANLALTPEQRLRQLDRMAAFARDVRLAGAKS
jgi:hypothetical protein